MLLMTTKHALQSREWEGSLFATTVRRPEQQVPGDRAYATNCDSSRNQWDQCRLECERRNDGRNSELVRGQSQKVAETLNDWLKDILPGIKPWISTEDISKGSTWFPALLGRLKSAKLCIICITPENVRSPWLFFEAGAIAGKGTESRVCSYLIGLEPAQLSNGPLGHFQATIADKVDTWKFVREINKHLQSGAHNEVVLEGNFEAKWPWLKQTLDAVLASYKDVLVLETPTTKMLRPVYQLGREAISLLSEAAHDPRGRSCRRGPCVGRTYRQMESSSRIRTTRAPWRFGWVRLDSY